MSLKILCAGCSKEERAAVEAEVADALGTRARNEPWTVSLVKVGDRWSVTLEGPDRATRGTAFMAPAAGLRESISDALNRGGPGPAAARGVPAPNAPGAARLPRIPDAAGAGSRVERR